MSTIAITPAALGAEATMQQKCRVVSDGRGRQGGADVRNT